MRAADDTAWTLQRLWQVGQLFPRNTATDLVATSVLIDASPAAVWRRIMLYEEVPRRPPFLLRLLLPDPVRSEGDKTRLGGVVRCIYERGNVVKHITGVRPPNRLQFEIVEQRLGIEACVTALGGSYEIRRRESRSEVLLMTNYRGHLRPRWFWRVVERFLLRRLHGHILDGMRAADSP